MAEMEIESVQVFERFGRTVFARSRVTNEIVMRKFCPQWYTPTLIINKSNIELLQKWIEYKQELGDYYWHDVSETFIADKLENEYVPVGTTVIGPFVGDDMGGLCTVYYKRHDRSYRKRHVNLNYLRYKINDVANWQHLTNSVSRQLNMANFIAHALSNVDPKWWPEILERPHITPDNKRRRLFDPETALMEMQRIPYTIFVLAVDVVTSTYPYRLLARLQENTTKGALVVFNDEYTNGYLCSVVTANVVNRISFGRYEFVYRTDSATLKFTDIEELLMYAQRTLKIECFLRPAPFSLQEICCQRMASLNVECGTLPAHLREDVSRARSESAWRDTCDYQ